MSTRSYYVLRIPIYGYSGMGYESVNPLVKTYGDEAEARKWLRRYTKAWELSDRQGRWGPGESPELLWTDREEEFMREMNDCVSFSFRGPPTLSLATTTEKVLT